MILAALGMVEVFQSTLPTRGSDTIVANTIAIVIISIHAPHEGERRDCF